MRVWRVAFAIAALSLAAPAAASAQDAEPQRTQVQFQYHETIAADADTAPAFLRIFARIRKDCELVGKAFDRKCTIRQINIYTHENYNNMTPTKMVNATASVVLSGEPAAASPPTTK